MAEKGPDEIFCRSCGEVIKKEAEICPECGVRNKEAEASTQQSQAIAGQHDPSQYETTVSESWWYGIVGGIALWILILAGTSVVSGGPLEAFMGFLALIAWAIMPIAIYFDIQYVRANSTWNPNTAIWVLAMVFWIVNIIGGAVYLYRRHESVGTP